MFRRIINTTLFLIVATAPLIAQPANLSRRYRVTVTNLTRGQGFSPTYIVTHSERFHLFDVGQPASAGVARIAEEGDASVALAENENNVRVYDQVVAGTMPFMPGQSVSAEVESIGGIRGMISVAGMLGSTNDAFYALNSESLPNDNNGSVTFYVPAYDAGSEANTESCMHVPGPPCAAMGVRMPEGAEGFVHIHAGIHGIADLQPAQLDWNNPVAKITIERVD